MKRTPDLAASLLRVGFAHPTGAAMAPADYGDPDKGLSQLAYDSAFNPTLGPLHID